MHASAPPSLKPLACMEFRDGREDMLGACVYAGEQQRPRADGRATAEGASVPVHHAMIVTRAAENTIWFASCNACLEPHQNCRSLIVAPDGQIHAQTELRREQLLVAEIDVDRATQAMFHYNLEQCAEMLFADTVQREEFASVLPDRK